MTGTHLRLGVVGCGRVFEQFHLPAIKASAQWTLDAICDTDIHRRKWVSQALPETPAFGSVEQMLDQVEIDAVLIATPPNTHAILSAQAIDRGMHVLLEKPGGRTLSDATQLEEFASRFRGEIWVGYNRRFNPNYQIIREIIERAPLSEDAVVHFDLSFSVDNWNSFSGYLGDETQGGGVVSDVASHQLDLLAWMFSAPVTDLRVRTWIQDGPAMERLTYEVHLGSGAKIRCLAEHGQDYRESLTLEDASRSLVSSPTGVLSTSKASLAALERWSGLRYWIDRKLMRMGMRVDPMHLAYSNQLQGFGTAICGGLTFITGSGVDAGIATHRAMEALIDSRDSSGAWRAVAPAMESY
jgi:predicted dehydrogenase